MARFAGVVTLTEVDQGLARLVDQGYLKYEKMKGGIYQFILYPEPVRELILNNDSR